MILRMRAALGSILVAMLINSGFPRPEVMIMWIVCGLLVLLLVVVVVVLHSGDCWSVQLKLRGLRISCRGWDLVPRPETNCAAVLVHDDFLPDSDDAALFLSFGHSRQLEPGSSGFPLVWRCGAVRASR